jgi:hypothetical protein
MVGCCEELNACAALEGDEGCSPIIPHISLCLSRQGIAPTAATGFEIEACLEDTAGQIRQTLTRRIEEVPELVSLMVALFDCTRSVPSATCTPDVLDDAGVIETYAYCQLNDEDDAGAPLQTCIEQCREELPSLYLCDPQEDNLPQVCQP